MYKALKQAKTLLKRVIKTRKGADPESAKRAVKLYTRDAAEETLRATSSQRQGAKQLEGRERRQGKK